MLPIDFIFNNEMMTILPYASHPIKDLIVQPSNSKILEIILPLKLVLLLKDKK